MIFVFIILIYLKLLLSSIHFSYIIE